MTTTRHITMSIDNGILSRTRTPKRLDGIFRNSDTGKDMTGKELIQYARELKAKGYEVIPVCDRHDDRGHCLGHPVEKEKEPQLEADKQ